MLETQQINNPMDGYADGFVVSDPVMRFPPNDLGKYDLGGNVWERREDWVNRVNELHVLRGISWGGIARAPLLSCHSGN